MQTRKHIRFDWAIKRLLRQKANFGILEGFLSELLKEDIHILEILDSESNKENEEDNRVAGRFNRVDILVKDDKGSDYVYRGTTCFRGIHDNQLLQLTLGQKRLFKKEKIEDVYPEIYLIKVNQFDDNARDTPDEWIYFLKNSEIKQDFTAKGIREADEVLRRANMSDEERREFQRFVEALSDQASAAFTIEFESTRKAEEKVKEAIERVEKETEERVKRETEERVRRETEERVKRETEEQVKKDIVINLLQAGMSDEQIAAATQVSVDFVRKTREEM
jgi:hypothetical protein